MPAPHLYTNRLIHQKSPYLLQHAHNPVNWYPWSEEAFTAAKGEDKPIFLSIGYATCHWCHVMERESFENLEVARLLNEVFINVKVDREELPEIDNLYMEFAQSMMAGSAGWPLNVILTPDLEPFFAATYLPPNSSHGMMGLTDLIQRMAALWKGEEREKIVEQAEQIVDVFSANVHVKGTDLPDEEEIDLAADLLFKMADPIYGGMKGAPKFPIGYQFGFLMRHYAKTKDGRSLFLAEKSLDMMHRGGIYDHLGGGFSRYSIDERWLIPHFEKMLYDNALISQAYLEAWQMTQNPLYRTICCEILDYILRDMTHPEGGFYSAEDADSEGHEGFFYTWTEAQVTDLLGEDAPLFCRFYGMTKEGNFHGRTILHTPYPLSIFASQEGTAESELKATLEKQKTLLWKAREKRIHPLKDDKVLCGWNGWMIHTLAQAGLALGQPRYLEAAVKAARFIRDSLWIDGSLFRRWRDGEAMFAGGLDEYASMIRACLTLFEAEAGTEWLHWAIEMAEILRLSYKAEEGGFYQTDGSDQHLLLRKCPFADGAEPSGNAIHCENLLRLYQIMETDAYLEQAEDIFKAVCDYVKNYSAGYTYHVMNLQHYYDLNSPTLVIALNSKGELEKELKGLLFSYFIPHRSIIWHRGEADLLSLIPSLDNQIPIQDQTTLYICREGACSAPLTDLTSMQAALAKL